MDSLVCKVIILENSKKALKPKKLGDNLFNFMKASPAKKNLFGVPNPEDTEKMLQEQLEIDRQRFSERFGFDLKDIEDLERVQNIENVNTNNGNQPVIRKERKFMRARRRIFKPCQNQCVMTDFYQARKNVQSLDKTSKDSNDSKEN